MQWNLVPTEAGFLPFLPWQTRDSVCITMVGSQLGIHGHLAIVLPTGSSNVWQSIEGTLASFFCVTLVCTDASVYYCGVIDIARGASVGEAGRSMAAEEAWHRSFDAELPDD